MIPVIIFKFSNYDDLCPFLFKMWCNYFAVVDLFLRIFVNFSFRIRVKNKIKSRKMAFYEVIYDNRWQISYPVC